MEVPKILEEHKQGDRIATFMFYVSQLIYSVIVINILLCSLSIISISLLETYFEIQY